MTQKKTGPVETYRSENLLGNAKMITDAINLQECTRTHTILERQNPHCGTKAFGQPQRGPHVVILSNVRWCAAEPKARCALGERHEDYELVFQVRVCAPPALEGHKGLPCRLFADTWHRQTGPADGVACQEAAGARLQHGQDARVAAARAAIGGAADAQVPILLNTDSLLNPGACTCEPATGTTMTFQHLQCRLIGAVDYTKSTRGTASVAEIKGLQWPTWSNYSCLHNATAMDEAAAVQPQAGVNAEEATQHRQ
mmetsp:Transcript_35240/g.69664  ORF Transcript_35240/g.69664 Transcript_35240/m.69664 type:complete len:255 (+) Transcript_35240:245-1009(+)